MKSPNLKILLLGANGQVGWELQRSVSLLGALKACDRKTADLENLEQLRATVEEFQPDIIINAAAYTAVDKAESDIGKARLVNAEAVALLASHAKQHNAWLIHYSTDYVFDGSKQSAYTEQDSPNPKSVYGQTKLEGEEAIRNSGCKHLIFRTSWVFAPHGDNFAKTILRLAQERSHLKIVADQIGAPTSAELIADVTAHTIHHLTLKPEQNAEALSGTYHLAPQGEVSWHGFATYLVEQAWQNRFSLQTRPDAIEPITTAEYPLPAKRPANSKLDSQKLKATFNLQLPSWQSLARRVVIELTNRCQ